MSKKKIKMNYFKFMLISQKDKRTDKHIKSIVRNLTKLMLRQIFKKCHFQNKLLCVTNLALKCSCNILLEFVRSLKKCEIYQIFFSILLLFLLFKVHCIYKIKMNNICFFIFR